MVNHDSEVGTLAEVAFFAMGRSNDTSTIVLFHFDLTSQRRRDSGVADPLKTDKSARDRSSGTVNKPVAS